MFTTFADRLTGYRRRNGPPGIRNNILAISTNALTDGLVARGTHGTGAIAVMPAFQRGLTRTDTILQAHALDRHVLHPNTAAAILVTHDRDAALSLGKRYESIGKPVETIAFLAAATTSEALSRISDVARSAVETAASREREAMRASELIVGLECGGSDPTSALCANPAIGAFVERLVDAGGTAIISETAEFIGAERAVLRQARTPQVARTILERVEAKATRMAADGIDYRGINPTPENIAAGITTLVEKSLGAVCKIGAAQIEGVLDFGQPPPGPGVWFMDTPYFSPTSIGGMAMAGAHLTLFALGGFNPSHAVLAPSVRICGNPETLRTWAPEIDVDLSSMLENGMSLDDARAAIGYSVERIVNGKESHSELTPHDPLILPWTGSAL